jgi:hypothetical protein
VIVSNALHVRRAAPNPSGLIMYEEYYPARAKDTIDQIDETLAEHFGLSQPQVEYLINHQIKYRRVAD